jgi:nucleoside-diphosphate-sugar epimerase
MEKVLITGISGFVDSHLTEYLLLHDQHVSGFDFRTGKLPTDRVANASVLHKTNLLETVALFDSIMEFDIRPVVFVASSSVVYRHKSGEKQISERAIFTQLLIMLSVKSSKKWQH